MFNNLQINSFLLKINKNLFKVNIFMKSKLDINTIIEDFNQTYRSESAKVQTDPKNDNS